MYSIIREEEIFSDSSYYCWLTTANDNQYHRHEFIEIYYVLSGSAEQIINGEKEVINRGGLYLLRPNDFHCYQHLSTDEFIHRDICVKLSEFKMVCDFLNKDFYSTIMNAPKALSTTIKIESIEHFENMLNIGGDSFFSNPNTLSYRAVLAELILILVKLNNIIKPMHAVPNWINELIEYMNTPYVLNSMTISDILNTIPYSRPYICSTFKKHTGQTLSHYYNDIKLKHAKYMILTTTSSVSSIAKKIGFDNLSYFYREFHKKYLTTPKELRRLSTSPSSFQSNNKPKH